ncbi:hypothetical protein Poly59_13530 [Rubripirellula reticaptiva]|uniref:Uncharacterized protein n=1 Tax=Rubripirellula reticaptiva TaxID=2528013 RepID=A0A5C6F3H9_9BACT|nr:hypothetical protein Poly59_13530 [Rubripirellula reticaptiva]
MLYLSKHPSGGWKTPPLHMKNTSPQNGRGVFFRSKKHRSFAKQLLNFRLRRKRGAREALTVAST